VLKLFSTGIVANLVYVATGALKQYFIAAQLTVPDVGVYGAWVAQASLLVLVVPLPAYLDLLIKGFSAAPSDHPTRGNLVSGTLREFKWLAAVAIILLACVLGIAAISGERYPTAEALLILVTGQYLFQIADIALRMYRAHQRYALFLATRNLPSLGLIIFMGLDSPMAIVLVELLSALIIGGLAFRSHALQGRDRSLPLEPLRATMGREQRTLWFARGLQFINTSLLRLVAPFIFSAYDTGLFFFAMIAQLPASLFLSVNTQMFGHALARIEPNAWPTLWRIQSWFLLPNLLYVVGLVVLVPFWPALMQLLNLGQYADIGWLVVAVALYSAVTSSDCTEYLLRSRGLSHILLRYNLCSILAQITCLGACAALRIPIHLTIAVCAMMSCLVLAGFSAHSFRRVLGTKNPSNAD
jgi:hypothetical protein